MKTRSPFKDTPQIKQEIAQIESELNQKKKELIEQGQAERHDKQLIKEIIKSKASSLPPVSVGPTSPPLVKKDEPNREEKQIKFLSNLAIEKGISRAIEVANKLDDPYLLDKFHDLLVDKLYAHLLETGKLKQI